MTAVTNELLYEILKTLQAGQAELRQQVGVLAQGQVSMRSDITSMRSDMASLRGDMHNEISGMRGDMKHLLVIVQEIALAVDHHTQRLDRIEQHLGLDTTPH